MEEKDRTNKSNKRIMPTVAKGSRHCPSKREAMKAGHQRASRRMGCLSQELIRSALPPYIITPPENTVGLQVEVENTAARILGMGTDSKSECHCYRHSELL